MAWGGINEKNGDGILTKPFISGGWTWTGWDYRGTYPIYLHIYVLLHCYCYLIIFVILRACIFYYACKQRQNQKYVPFADNRA